MNDKRQRDYTRQVILECKQTIAKVDALVARHKQMLASRGLDPEQLRRQLDALGPAARLQVERRVEELMKEADRKADQEAAHAQFTSNAAPLSRRMRDRV